MPTRRRPGPALQGLGKVSLLGWAAILLAAAVCVITGLVATGTAAGAMFRRLHDLRHGGLGDPAAADRLHPHPYRQGLAPMSTHGSPTTRRFVRTAWILLAFQLARRRAARSARRSGRSARFATW